MPVIHRHLLGAMCLFAALAPPLMAAESASSQTLERIVAVVNDDVILASELDNEIVRIRQRLQREGRNLPPPDVLREHVLDQLIDQQLQLQQARQRGISVDDEAVNEAMRSMAQNYDTDLAGLQAQFRERGLGPDALREDVRQQLIISRLRQRAVASDVQVTAQDIDDFLARVERASEQRQQYRVRHILIGLPSDASSDEVSAARQRAQEAVARLQDGADFSELASRVSDGPRAMSGGDLGWRRPGELPELFTGALEDVPPGGIAGPLRSPNGFHILQLADLRGGGGNETITQARVRHILLEDESDSEGGGGGNDPQQRLEQLRQRLQSGADFATLARAHSDDQSSAPDGGELGWVSTGELPPVVHEVIRDLPTGQLSEPFRSPMGWHLIEVIERRQQRDAEQQRRTQARRTLYQREIEEESQQWLKRLREDAYVDIRLGD